MTNNNHITDQQLDESMPLTDDNIQEDALESNVTFADGYTFTFHHKGHEIVAYGSAKSGKESLTIDGKLLSEKRSFGRRSTHSFTLDGVNYEIEFYMANMFTGELHCMLIEEGTHVSTQKKALKKSNQVSSLKGLLIMLFAFIGGGIVGFVSVWQGFDLLSKFWG
ncbi:hypothetical protein [Thalassotalea fusca]